MSDKKITELQLRSNVNDDVNIPVDDGIQSYRVTAPQVATYVQAKPVNVVTKTATYTAALTNHLIICDATGGGFTINLPTAVGIEGKIFHLKKIDTTLNAILIDPAGSETLEGAASKKLVFSGDWMRIVSDGADWLILDRQQVSPWMAAPALTYSGGFGSVTSESVFMRRNGSEVEMKGAFQTGSPAASIMYIQLPAAMVIDLAFINTLTSQLLGLSPGTEGLAVFAGANGRVLFSDGSTNDSVFFGLNGSGGGTYTYVKANGSGTINTNENMPIQFSVPIVGWN